MRPLTIVLVTGLTLIQPTIARAQPIHLPPMYSVPIARGTPLLTITVTGSDLQEGIRVGVHDDQLVIFLKNGQETYPLGNSTLAQLATAIKARHPKVQVVASYPFASASNLRSTPIPVDIDDGQVVLHARGMTPRIEIGFGVVLSMPEGSETVEGDGVLDQTGFQLDLVGSHRLRGSRARDADGNPLDVEGKDATVSASERWARWLTGDNVYAQVRLGLNSDQQLNVATTKNVDQTTGAQVETAIMQADQISLSGQFEFVWPVSGLPVELSLIPEYGVSWTRPDNFRFPQLQLEPDTERAPSEAFFDAELRTVALRQLNTTFPLSTLGISALARFRRDDRIGFYVGGGLLSQELIRRGILFSRDDTGRIDPTSLRPFIESDGMGFWRAMFGARLSGVIDLRVDATGPLEDRQEHPPILRLVLIREFPVQN